MFNSKILNTLVMLMSFVPSILLITFVTRSIGADETPENIEKLKELGLYTVGSAGVLFWLYFFLFWFRSKSIGIEKAKYSILFILGGFISPAVYCVYRSIMK